MDCKHEFAQLLSDGSGLYFAISCLMVLLPVNPHVDLVIVKTRKRKKTDKHEPTHPHGLGQ